MSENLSFKPYTLSPLDHIMIPTHVCVFLSFKTREPSYATALIEKGISALISERPYLAGNISQVDQPSTLEVHPPSAADLQKTPMLAVRHRPNKTISCISSSDTILNEDFRFGDHTIPTPYPTFALRFQANIMKDGIILTICFYHRFVEFYGLMLILTSLAQCCQSQAQGSPPGLSLLCPPSDASGRSKITASPGSPLRDVGGTYGRLSYHYSPGQNQNGRLTCQKYVLRPEKITFLKNACNSLLPILVQGFETKESSKLSKPLSSTDAISALLWLCCIRARFGPSLANDKLNYLPQEFSFTGTFETRHILQPKSLKRHIGNCVILAKSHYNFKDLQDPGKTGSILTKKQEELLILTQLALRIRHECDSIDKDHVQNIINHAAGSQDPNSFVFLPADVSMTSLRKMGIYGLDFGKALGRVTSFDAMDDRLEGYCYILPEHSQTGLSSSQSKQSPWEIRITLDREATHRLQQDELFSWAGTSDNAKL